MNRLFNSIAGVAALAAASAFTSGGALAADMPVYKAPPPPVYSWTGCYVGVGFGYKMWNADRDYVDTTTGIVAIHDGTSGGRGWLVRGQAGCDYQIAGSWLIGIFGDIDGTNAHGDYFQRFGAPLTINTSGDRKERSSWAIGGRIGYLVMPSLLTYFSGGYTEARFDATDLVLAAAPIGAATGIQIGSQNYHGGFIGSGFEYNIGFLPGLTLKTEYRFASYRSGDSSVGCVSTAPGICAPVGAFTFVDRAKLYQQSVTTELVWRFGGGAVRAAY